MPERIFLCETGILACYSKMNRQECLYHIPNKAFSVREIRKGTRH